MEKPVQYREILFPDKETSLIRYICEGSRGIGPLSLVNVFIGANNSGKSRLLRSLFSSRKLSCITNKANSQSVYNLIKNKKQDFKAIFRHDLKAYGDVTPDYLTEILDLDADNQPIYGLTKTRLQALQFVDENSKMEPDNGSRDRKWIIQRLHEVGKICLEELIALNFETEFNKENKYYIPILRGMRPLKGHSSPYEERSRDDYFKDLQITNDRKQLFTGLELYSKLRAMLLGEPDERERVGEFENYLEEQFFFKKVTLIPYEEKGRPDQSDQTVRVKIGQEPQLPIYHLGDGLQSLIICAFNIFMERERCLFFIEEPDTHMHPSLQRAFLEMLQKYDHHQYFLTSHSNHLLDMAMDTSDVSIFHFSKTEDDQVQFKIRVTAPGDQEMLRDLGVRNSSVFLANATIWVEGITDRLYLREYMTKYVAELKETDPDRAQKYSQFREDAHYSFVEYQGANLTHWSFDAEDTDPKCIRAPFVCAAPFLIADGDVVGKGQREQTYRDMLGDNFYILPYKEVENLMPVELLRAIVAEDFKKLEKDVANIDSVGYTKPGQGLGRYLDDVLEIPEEKSVFAAASGTLKSHKKIALCNKAVALAKMQEPAFEWGLTDKLTELCEKIFAHIEQCNQ